MNKIGVYFQQLTECRMIHPALTGANVGRIYCDDLAAVSWTSSGMELYHLFQFLCKRTDSTSKLVKQLLTFPSIIKVFLFRANKKSEPMCQRPGGCKLKGWEPRFIGAPVYESLHEIVYCQESRPTSQIESLRLFGFIPGIAHSIDLLRL